MKLVPLKTLASIQLGKMLSPKAKTGHESFTYLRNQNVQWGRFSLDDLAVMDFNARDREKFELLDGDLLICEGGEPGRCAVWRSEVEHCYYQKAIHRVRPIPGAADSDFLAHWIRLQAFKGTFEEQNAKTTIAHLPLVRLERMSVPAFNIDQQREIAGRLKAQLAELETAKQAARALRNETDALFTSTYREAFAQVVPVMGLPEVGKSPAGWHWQKLTELARLESGHTPSRSRSDWWGGDISWLSLTEIRALDGQWVDETQIRTNTAGIANSSARVLPRGTVCFSRTASVGFVAIMGKPMATSQDFANWVCGDALDPEFLMHALIRSRKELRELATGATHKTIYMPMLESFRICAPDIATQRRIARDLDARLAEVSAMRAAFDEQQQQLAHLPQRLLAQAFGDAA